MQAKGCILVARLREGKVRVPMWDLYPFHMLSRWLEVVTEAHLMGINGGHHLITSVRCCFGLGVMATESCSVN